MPSKKLLENVLQSKLESNSLILPTLPEIAIKVREEVECKKTDVKKLTDVIITDPALSARLIKIANTASMRRAVSVTNVSQAVKKIGLSRIKNIATALVMEQLFVTKNPEIKDILKSVWDDTVEMVSSTLAIHTLYLKAFPKDSSMNRDTLMLCALVLNLGALPIIKELESQEEPLKGNIYDIIKSLGPKIGVSILESWNFDNTIVNVSKLWRKAGYLDSDIYYVDIVKIGAAALDRIPNPSTVLKNAFELGIIESIDINYNTQYLEAKKDALSIFK